MLSAPLAPTGSGAGALIASPYEFLLAKFPSGGGPIQTQVFLTLNVRHGYTTEL